MLALHRKQFACISVFCQKGKTDTHQRTIKHADGSEEMCFLEDRADVPETVEPSTFVKVKRPGRSLAETKFSMPPRPVFFQVAFCQPESGPKDCIYGKDLGDFRV